MSVVTLLGLVLDVGGVDRDPAGLLFRRGVDLVIGLRLAAELLGQHVGDGGGQGGFAMVHVADGADIDVGLRAVEFLFGHGCLLKGGREDEGELCKRVEPTTGLEPVTSSLPRKCSTTELCGLCTFPPPGG